VLNKFCYLPIIWQITHADHLHLRPRHTTANFSGMRCGRPCYDVTFWRWGRHTMFMLMRWPHNVWLSRGSNQPIVAQK